MVKVYVRFAEKEFDCMNERLIKLFKQKTSQYPVCSSKREIDSLELLDGAYDIIEIWNAATPAQIEWKKNWLVKARELGANPSW